MNGKEAQNEEYYSESYIENRAGEYAGRWNKNVFLNDFDEEDGISYQESERVRQDIRF